MALKADESVVSAVVSRDTHDRLSGEAAQAGTSVSKLLGLWIRSVWTRHPHTKIQTARKAKDELMVSIPRSWLRTTGTTKGDRLLVTHTDDTLIIRKY